MSEFDTALRKYNHNHGKDGRFCSSEETTAISENAGFDVLEFLMARKDDPNYETPMQRNKRIAGEKMAEYTTTRKRQPENAGENVDWPSAAEKLSSEELISMVDSYMPDLFPVCEKMLNSGLDPDDASKFERGAHGNEFLLAAQQEAGFKDKPLVLSHEEFSGISTKIYYRGFDEKWKDNKLVMTGKEKVDRFVEGDGFTGLGSYGDGVYMTDNFYIARNYSNKGTSPIVTMKMFDNAVIADYDLLYEEMDELVSILDSCTSSDDKLIKAATAVVNNEGTYAVLRGYDGLDVGNGITVALNKGKIALDESDLAWYR